MQGFNRAPVKNDIGISQDNLHLIVIMLNPNPQDQA